MPRPTLILLLVVFMLLETSSLPARLQLLPKFSDDVDERLDEILKRVRHYMTIKTGISLLTGLLVPAGDEAALANAVDDLLRQPEKARRLGAAGRQLAAEEHDCRRQAAALVAAYIDALTGGAVTYPQGREERR